MKDFTAIQNTEYLQGVGYSFKANNLDEAIEKAKSLMTGEITDVYEVDDLGNRVNVLVETNLSNGGVVKYIGIDKYDNKPYEKTFNTIDDFINEFKPNKLSDNLINRIKEEWNKGGKIVYKPIGYKANQIFYFNV